MTQDEIIEMARQAGVDSGECLVAYGWFSDALEAFAKLVADVATAKEREACAKVCENVYTGEESCGDWPTPEMCAEAIRARGNKE